MRNRKSLPATATLQEGPELFLISRAIAIDELRKRLIVPPHREGLECNRLLRLSRSVSLNNNLKKFLIKASNPNQPALAIDHGLAAITRHMIAPNLKLPNKLIAKIQQHQRVVEIFIACRKSMTEDARANRHRQLRLAA